MILGGEPIDGAKARRIVLVKAFVSPADLMADCECFAHCFTRTVRPVLVLAK